MKNRQINLSYSMNMKKLNLRDYNRQKNDEF